MQKDDLLPLESIPGGRALQVPPQGQGVAGRIPEIARPIHPQVLFKARSKTCLEVKILSWGLERAFRCS